jgi:pilus assembly protein FimV
MMRKFVSVILLSVFSAGVSALGLGNIQLNSGLNQPFDAKIELLSPTASELDSLTVSLATVEAFERAGIDRAFVLGSLRFEIQQGDSGQDFVHVTSRESLREPFLNFLIEASWANGRLYREYTVLLDPPLYDPYAGRPVTANTASDNSAGTGTAAESASVNNSTSAEPTGSDFSGNEVGPIAASETLWSVASRVRPDSSVTVNQMMLALFRANPDAFIGNNINGLKQGQILRVPELGDINSTTYAAAVEEVRSQNALWEDIRGSVASTPVERPVSTSSEPASQATVGDSVSASAADTGSELRLLAPGDQGTIAGQATSATTTANADTGLGLMNEQVVSLTSENSELRGRLTESETIIEDLKRLIDLKDDELATLQQQMGGTPASVAEAVGTDEQSGEPAQTEVTDTPVSTETELVPEDTSAIPDAQVDEGVTESADTTAMVEEPAAEPVTVEAQTDPAYEPGLVEQILGFVFGNLLLVGGGLVAILLLAMVPSILRKRKEAAIEADQNSQIAFPDFNAAQTESDAADGPQMDFDIDMEAEAVAPAAAQLADTLDPQSMRVEVTAAAPEVAEEDPLAEVNVFLAYEHFDSAEEFVRDAISRQPANLDFHSKLLEVFYSAGDKAKYEEEARVLYDLVSGSGPHWDMAMIMWQEMSPNRALFAEPAEGEDDVRADVSSGGGIVDLTADDSSTDDAGLDFDLGMTMDVPASASKESGDEDMLDITAAVSTGSDNEDILDVTAAVGLETMQERPADEMDIMDISTSGTDDLLDVTAHSGMEAGQDEDVLDISMNPSALTDAPEFESMGNTGSSDDNLLDFDIGALTETDSEAENALILDEHDGGIELDFGTEESAEEGSLELSMDFASKDDDSGLSLDFDTESASVDEDSLDLSMDLDVPDSSNGGLELDFEDDDANPKSDVAFELDLAMEDDSSPSSLVEIDMDMDSTVKIPKSSVMSLDSLEFDNDDDDDDDEGDHTVFVARTNDAGEQSADDENATKLDLAKAYVELGDSDNAKSILEEVIAEGNPAQRRQAQELMTQIA